MGRLAGPRIGAVLLTAALMVAPPAPAQAGGDDWPTGLQGPFSLDRYERLQIRAHDGITLDGVVAIPRLPDGVKAPVVLQMSPYHASLDPAGDEPEQRSGRPEVVPRDALVRAGYAVAYVNVRGTGASGGCFDFLGEDEQRDSVTIVEDLAERPWSTGKVGAIGVSYDAGPAFQAAVRRAKGLAAVVASGLVSDYYGVLFSPQGAVTDDQWAGVAGFYAAVSNAPRRGPQESQVQLLLDQLAATEALCPDVAEWMAHSSASFALPDRDPAFFAERDLLSDFDRIKAAVLVAQGFRDHLSFTDDTVFGALEHAPRHQLSGQWVHRFPTLEDWDERLVRFFDAYLKDEGPRPPEGAEFYDSAGRRHVDQAWPPLAARDQALAVTPGRFSTLPDPATAEWSLSQHQDDFDVREDKPPNHAAYGPRPPCKPFEGATALTSLTPGVEAPTVVAGNPRALVRLKSDRSQGAFVLRLFRLRAGFDCTDAKTYDYMGSGAVDLRHHAGNLSAKPFTPGVVQPVRIDVQNMAFALEPGDRVAAVLQFGPYKTNAAGLGTTIDIAGGEVALPVLEGGFGLAPPRESYPPRPRSGP